MTERWLEGNGAGLVRERALANAVQTALERLYRIDRTADVRDYLAQAADGREVLALRQAEDGALEIALHVPLLAERDIDMDHGDLDPLCQLIEGVSHFVYITHRCELGREASELELEVQAEVDKWVVLASSIAALDVPKSARLRERLYERVTFLHEEQTERGERYRVANDVASRFVRRIEQTHLRHGRVSELRHSLRTFFGMGQTDKIRLAHAA